MTNEEINSALAEACPDKFRYEYGWYFQYAPDCWSQCHNSSLCEDLNAMHEAEKVIRNNHNLWTNYFYSVGATIALHATARQRAEAFLRTLGRWKE